MYRRLFPLLFPLLIALAACGSKTADDTADTGHIVAVADEDGDGFDVDADCDDTNADVYPGAAEVCDGLDNDCDDVIDEGVESTYYSDADGDGYGNALNETEACEAPSGYAEDATDCDDADDSVNPGAEEVCDGADNDCDEEIDEDLSDADEDGICDDLDAEDCDGIDNDGDGSVDEDYDVDGDGYTQCGSDDADADCNDDDDAISPGETETLGNTTDDDCDGMIDENFVAGDLLITEIMSNPAEVSDANGEWFEVYNTTDETLYLDGLIISSTTESGTAESHTIVSDDPIAVEAGAHAVLGRNDEDSANGGVDVMYAYESVVLGNGSDYVEVSTSDGDSIVTVTWDDGVLMPDASGATMSLDPDHTDETDPSWWCAAATQWDTGSDYGTPGEANESCETIDIDGDGYTPAEGDCDNTDDSIYPGADDVWYDGVDSDCDEASDYDADSDGYDSDAYSGGDCDDTTDEVSPGASESCNEIDDDCDGNIDEGCDDTGWEDTGLSGDTGTTSTGVDGDYTGTITVALDMLGLVDSCSGPA